MINIGKSQSQLSVRTPCEVPNDRNLAKIGEMVMGKEIGIVIKRDGGDGNKTQIDDSERVKERDFASDLQHHITKQPSRERDEK